MKDIRSSTTRRNLTMGYEARDNLATITDLQGSANNQTFTYTPRESLATATGPYGAIDVAPCG